jgi:hypothetical protein
MPPVISAVAKQAAAITSFLFIAHPPFYTVIAF